MKYPLLQIFIELTLLWVIVGLCTLFLLWRLPFPYYLIFLGFYLFPIGITFVILDETGIKHYKAMAVIANKRIIPGGERIYTPSWSATLPSYTQPNYKIKLNISEEEIKLNISEEETSVPEKLFNQLTIGELVSVEYGVPRLSKIKIYRVQDVKIR